MRKAVVIAMMAWAWSLGAAAAPLGAYGRLPNIEEFQISPDGARLAYVTTVGEQRRVLIQDASGKGAVCAIGSRDAKLRSLQWAGPGHVVVVVSETTMARGVWGPRSEYFMAHVLDAARCKASTLEPSPELGMAMNVIVDLPQVRTMDGHAVVFFEGIRFEGQGYGRRTLYRRDVATGRTVSVEEGNLDTQGWVIGEAGDVVAATEYDDKAGRWTLLAKRDRRWAPVLRLDAKLDPPQLFGLGRTPGTVLLRLIEDDRVTTRELSLADGRWGDVLSEHVNDLIESPVTHRPIGGEALTATRAYTFFDPADQAQWSRISRAFKNADVSLISWTDDRKLVVVRVTGESYGAAYYGVDLKTGRADELAPLYRDVAREDVAPVTALTYTASDGRAIPAYLTLPKGKAAKGLPLVVMPHGGPGTRDEPGFDWWAQALASRGYAVLQPQFRGSAGYGRDHLFAGHGEWGRKMQTDLSDGVAYLASQGTIDPKRACIVGASYGGYAALAGVTLQQGVYRCAVSVGGLSDLPRFLNYTRERVRTGDRSLAVRYWLRFMGADDRRDAELQALSPATHASQVAAPVLLVHGRDDTVVPLDQSRRMADALQRGGKPVKLVVLFGEDHWLSLEATRSQMLTETVAFLETHNPAD